MWPDRREREAAILAPAEKLVTRPQICPRGVRVADIRREEFDIALGGFVAEIGDERRHDVHRAPVRGDFGLLDRRRKLCPGRPQNDPPAPIKSHA
jgi:hypothetical protein